MPPPLLFTIGYEGRNVDELVELLRQNDIKTLVDVRLNAISRRHGFSKSALAETLAAGGITYVHERGLGNPPENRPGYRAGERSAHTRYLKHLQGSGAEAIHRVTSLVHQGRTALLCVEREAGSCHRTAVAETLPVTVISL